MFYLLLRSFTISYAYASICIQCSNFCWFCRQICWQLALFLVCSYFFSRQSILALVTTILSTSANLWFTLVIFSLRTFFSASFLSQGSLGRVSQLKISPLISPAPDIYLYILMPSSMPLLLSDSISSHSKGDIPISPFKSSSRRFLCSSERQSQSRQSCPAAQSLFLSISLLVCLFTMLISVNQTSSYYFQCSILYILMEVFSIYDNLSISFLDILPDSTSVRNAFLFLISEADKDAQIIELASSYSCSFSSDQISDSKSMDSYILSTFQLSIWSSSWVSILCILALSCSQSPSVGSFMKSFRFILARSSTFPAETELTNLSQLLGKFMMFLDQTSFTYFQRSLNQFYLWTYCSVFSFFFLSAGFYYLFVSSFYFGGFDMAVFSYFFCYGSAAFFDYLFSPGLLILNASNLILDLMASLTFSYYCFCVVACFNAFIFCLFFSANPRDNVSCSSSFSTFYTFSSIFLLLLFSMALSFFFQNGLKFAFDGSGFAAFYSMTQSFDFRCLNLGSLFFSSTYCLNQSAFSCVEFTPDEKVYENLEMFNSFLEISLSWVTLVRWDLAESGLLGFIIIQKLYQFKLYSVPTVDICRNNYTTIIISYCCPCSSLINCHPPCP